MRMSRVVPSCHKVEYKPWRQCCTPWTILTNIRRTVSGLELIYWMTVIRTLTGWRWRWTLLKVPSATLTIRSTTATRLKSGRSSLEWLGLHLVSHLSRWPICCDCSKYLRCPFGLQVQN
uniref:Uncharacterized protein n=1 Tax=Cacopsylla melanoneura TaxID=428564 RepID=A0A8D8YTH4_9HEMI